MDTQVLKYLLAIELLSEIKRGRNRKRSTEGTSKPQQSLSPWYTLYGSSQQVLKRSQVPGPIDAFPIQTQLQQFYL